MGRNWLTHKTTEKEKATLWLIPKSPKAMIQAYWKVPIYPGEEGSITANATMIKSIKEA